MAPSSPHVTACEAGAVNFPLTLILGGRSEIGVAIARRLARAGATGTVVLAARRSADLVGERAAIAAEGDVTVVTEEFDADDPAAAEALLGAVVARHGEPDLVVLAVGVLGDQARAETDTAHAVAVVHTDYVAQVAALTPVADRMRVRGRGEIVVLSSIAGVRVRRANYVYGSAKAGLDGFASGLADALRGSGAHLTLVRPGFVVGRMTAGSGLTPAPLSSTPDAVAAAAVTGLARGADVVWVPRSLALLAAVLRALPRPLWRRLPR